MGVIKGVLKEELKNSLRMEKEYEAALGRLPKGCLAIRKIRGHKYYYLVKRVNGKVKYHYKGKLSQVEVKEHEKAKKQRTKYQKLLRQVREQIKFIRRSLRGKESA